MTVTPTRTPRLAPPPVPTGRLQVQPPPELTPSDGISGMLATALPMLGSVGSIVFIAVAQPGGKSMIAAGMFLVATLGFVGVNGWRQRAQHQAGVVGARREYLAYLADLRETVREAARLQRRNAEWNSPDPRSLALLAEERSRVWERLPEHDDFLHARFGRSDQPLSLTLDPPETPALAQLDPVSASAAHRFLVTHSTQRDLPVAADLRSVARVELTGGEDEVRALARAVVTQLATFHSPEHLRIAVLASEAALPAWDWAKWLPHTHSPRARDAVGPARLIAGSITELEGLLPEDIPDRPRFGVTEQAVVPHLLVVVDGGEVPPGDAVVTPDGVVGVTVLDLPERWDELDSPTTLRVTLGSAPDPQAGVPGEVLHLRRLPEPVRVDQMSVADAEAAARRLTPLHVESGPAQSDGSAVSAELVDLLGIGDVRDFDPALHWRPRLQRDRLRVPIGLTSQGQPIALDIKESAQQGMGPHGLIIGATGSGKSEVLRTLVLALALTHSSEDLNFVLVDFKGGATFAGMADMPHVSAIITNLGEELTLVDRMQDALQGEMTRRQELLRASGNFANVTDYEKARAGGRTDLEPLPALLIVADEFSELLSAKPEFVDLFVAIGRLGRSLQMHLLLSSQRLEEGRLRGLESHLSYRIGLRTFSAAESRTVLGVPDAYTLPAVPGMGYLKPDTTTMIQFRASYVSGPPPARRRTTARGVGRAVAAAIQPFTAAPVRPAEGAVVVPEQPVAPAAQAEETRAQFDIAVQRMKGKGRPAHKVWLEPLVVPATFDGLMPDLAVDPHLGLVSPTWRAAGDLVLPLGTVDRPLEQRRENLTIDLGGAGGHMAIVGGPRTGKSTTARSVVTALALTRTPLEVQVYVLDFGGGTFSPLARLPHVAGVASRAEPDVVRRVVAEIRGIVDARELYFRTNGIDSIETYRRRRAAGTADDGYGDVFLVVDGWSTVRAEFDELEPEIQALAGRGLTFGLHLVATAARWMDFRTQIKDLFGTRLELRLGDPMDSEIDRKVAVNVPTGRPGRGLTTTKHHVLTALPRVDGSGDGSTLGQGVDHLIASVTAAWTGPAGPKLRLLPEHVSLDEVRAQAGPDDRRLLLGVDEAALAPVGILPGEEAHLYAFGDGGSGKSGLLRGVVREVQRLYPPAGAQILAIDYRRSLLGEIPDEYLLGYLTTQEQAQAELTELAGYLRGRLPGPDVTPDQLRKRSWWSGAEVFVLVDDYDLVATSSGNPVSALVPLLAQAGDVGLHLVLTRRTGGAGRAMYEPVLQALKDLAAPGLVLSGSPDEGALVGTARPTPAVPGRGQLVTRDHGRQVVQLALTPTTT